MEGKNHSPETAIALLGQAMENLTKAVEKIEREMVTHEDLDRLATKSEFSALSDRVKELERGTLKKIVGNLSAFAAGGLSVYAFFDLLRSLFGKGH